MWKLLLLLPIVLYLAVCAALFFAQASLVFPVGAVAEAGPLPPGGERLVVETAAGERLHGIRIRGNASGQGPLLLGFGGNGWNAEDVASTLAGHFPEHDVVAFHYRGYRPSTGSPSATALLADAPLVHDEIVRRDRPRAVVAIGFSVGAGVAARLARERPLAGLILVTPFDSLAVVAAGHYPWLPVRLLFRHEMPAAADLAERPVPVAVIAAEQDALIPAERTEALRRGLPRLVFDRTIAGADHNDIYQRESFDAAIREALAAILRRR